VFWLPQVMWNGLGKCLFGGITRSRIHSVIGITIDMVASAVQTGGGSSDSI